MATVQCPNKHFYNDEQHTSCPYCGVQGLRTMNIPKTQAAPGAGSGGAKVKPTEPDRRSASTAGTRPAAAMPKAEERLFSSPGSYNPTISAIRVRTGINPVVGWVVCIKGPNKGRDYRLHSDRNQVGRAPNMDICIESDDTISRENHCQLVFSPRTKSFVLVPGTGRNLIYLNGSDVHVASELEPYDKIDIGQGTFMFVPFCNEQIAWEKMEEDEKSRDPE
jgi:Inner membrane component of T3SS, cytoplasmic domain